MAIIHRATLTPSKLDLLLAWVPSQPWLGGADTSSLEPVATYRFDDPAGEVGIETHLLRSADGRLVQVPLTYRGAPLAGMEGSLLDTVQHSVLGRRWVYDACADAVYAAALATAILTGGREAELAFITEDGVEIRHSPTRVFGSGSPDTAVPAVDQVRLWHLGRTTVVQAATVTLTVLRVLAKRAIEEASETLTGTWPGNDDPSLLAIAQLN